MPRVIPIDLSGAEVYENLPEGKYYAQVDSVTYRETEDEDKFDQIMVTYLVTDGELTGRKSSEFLSMSPKAAFRLAKFFDRFGVTEDLDENEGIVLDDDSDVVLEPDLVGIDCIIEVAKDKKPYKGEYPIRTTVVEVIDEEEDEPEPEPAPKKRTTRKAAKPAPEPEPEEDEEEEDEEEEPEEKPARAARPVRRSAKAAAPERPKRRTLK